MGIKSAPVGHGIEVHALDVVVVVQNGVLAVAGAVACDAASVPSAVALPEHLPHRVQITVTKVRIMHQIK